MKSMKSYPMDREGWYNFYVTRWCKNQSPTTLQLAMWYLILIEGPQ
jgi:hypothetical protein